MDFDTPSSIFGILVLFFAAGHLVAIGERSILRIGGYHISLTGDCCRELIDPSDPLDLGESLGVLRDDEVGPIADTQELESRCIGDEPAIREGDRREISLRRIGRLDIRIGHTRRTSMSHGSSAVR